MKQFAKFLRDESASVSIFNLIMLLFFCMIMGLAIDFSAGIKAKTRLQHVADTASHAGVMDLSPDPGNAIVTALNYGAANMSWVPFVVKSEDVELGYWEPSTRTFYNSGLTQYNAVRVFSNRLNDRQNAVDLTLLAAVASWTGLEGWDVRAHSISSYGEFPECLAKDGMYAGGTMEQTSNNTIKGPYCMYGDTLFKISQNNLIDCAVDLMTPSPDNYQNGTPPTGTSDIVCDQSMMATYTSQEMIEKAFSYQTMPVIARDEYNMANAVLGAFAAGKRPWNFTTVNGLEVPEINDIHRIIPPWMNDSYGPINAATFNNMVKNGTTVPGTLYHVVCGNSNKNVVLTGIVQNLGVYTDCPVDVQRDKDVSAVKPTKTSSGTNPANLCDPDTSDCLGTEWVAEIEEAYWHCEDAVAQGFEKYQTKVDTTSGLVLPYGTYKDGGLDYTAQECGIEPGANGVLDNVLVFTSAKADQPQQDGIKFSNNIQIGRIDACAEGGGVRFYTAASTHTPSGTTLHGVQFVALGSIFLAAKANGVMGTTAYAEENIKFTANGLMGGCPDDSNGSERVLSSRPIAIVD